MSDYKEEVGIDSLPPRQRDVVNHIMQLSEEHGYPPTLAELAAAMGLRNRMTVHQHVAALKKKGVVHWEPGLNRSLKVIGAAHEQSQQRQKMGFGDDNIKKPKNAGIHLAGTIAAGQPIDVVAGEEYLEIDSQYAGTECYALKVKGDSMIEDGICNGDYVIVKPNPSPRNGEIVVALLDDGSATLKRFFKESGRFRLQPANNEMQPIMVDASNDLQVQGTVVALFRKL